MTSDVQSPNSAARWSSHYREVTENLILIWFHLYPKMAKVEETKTKMFKIAKFDRQQFRSHKLLTASNSSPISYKTRQTFESLW